MPFNGSGVFNRIYSWTTDAANNLNVDSTRMDTDTNDIASGLTNCITKDGQSTPTANIPMGGNKLTGLGLGTVSTDAARVDNANALGIMEFRLTLTSGTPVTTSDVTAVTTLYLTPYKGDAIALYDGTNWHRRTSTEMSIAVPTVPSATNYDVFCYDNAGVPTLEITAWTNDTTRATALTKQDGVYVKTGATTRRYIGTIHNAASDGKLYDTTALRYVWNYYNRVRRQMLVTDVTASWNYTTNTIRVANGNGNNIVEVVVGVSEEPISVEVCALVGNSTGGTSAIVQSGFGIDSITAYSTSSFGNGVFRCIPVANTGGGNFMMISPGKFYLGAGRHYVSWLENSAAVGTTTWTGGNSSGLHGEVWG